jgi:hypothetical protein
MDHNHASQEGELHFYVGLGMVVSKFTAFWLETHPDLFAYFTRFINGIDELKRSSAL